MALYRNLNRLHQILDKHLMDQPPIHPSLPPGVSAGRQGVFKLLGLGLLCLIPVIMIIGCRDIASLNDLMNPQPLEFEQVVQYKINYNSTTNIPESISGFCLRSSFCVKSVTKKREGNALIILVNLGTCGKGETGDFFVNLDLTDDVNQVLFGPKKYVLWSREPKKMTAAAAQ